MFLSASYQEKQDTHVLACARVLTTHFDKVHGRRNSNKKISNADLYKEHVDIANLTVEHARSVFLYVLRDVAP